MYNSHRAMVPGAPGPNNRLTELLEQVRQEFDLQANRAGDFEQSVANQIHELDMLRAKLYSLEQTHHQVKQKYEDEIARLRHELERQGPNQPPHAGPSQPPPPSIGHGPGNLFGGIMAGGGQQGGQALAPPQPQDPGQQANVPVHLAQGPAGMNAQGPPPPPFYPPGPAPNGYAPGVPQPVASPGPRGGRNPRGPPGPATPQQNSAAPYPGSPQVPRPTPPPAQGPPLVRNGLSMAAGPTGNTLADLEINDLPPEYKKEGSDWYAVFNPRLRRTLDVDLVHTLDHNSVVCCVRFSLDGRFVATGCNRSAYIYDVQTGQRVAELKDESLVDDTDLYIRSVCFSPDGRYLATGAEDKIIRVWDIQSRTIKNEFRGHEQDIYSLDFARNGRLIASGSGDRTVRLWDVERNELLFTLQIDDGVTTVAISPDNRNVAGGSLDKSVRVWDTATGLLRERLEGDNVGHKDSVYSVAFSPSGREIVSGSLDKTIKMWELQPQHMMPHGGVNPPGRGQCTRTFEGHKDFVLSVALTPDGRWVLSGSKDRGVQFWDPLTGAAQLMLQGHKNSGMLRISPGPTRVVLILFLVISVAPSPQGGLFATGSGDLRARIWRYTEIRP
ncbi:WD40 repeat-like protein [Eremomyces bilateralis CBS 781.70]|uniref:WD40 repeat-like protein n=1 Tax=Eremomyces bilateralis CBS 781.70 TaxID=1392243 RepID=A0A6G1G4X4_9PEZI|nr:WD40 repeat-like protein [Eremomyces bilateralis CBS 781.70]KAF1813145.1 WD40 repeat-like protein [Eremomyces bilateralis CBS 781.70]